MPANPIKNGERISGLCLCHGIIVTGPAGTVAQPEPYKHRDLFSDKALRCWAVVQNDGEQPHDVPLSTATRV